MALQAFLASTSAAGTIANLGTTDDAVVGTGVTLASGGNAITGVGSNQTVSVFGAIFGANSAIKMGASGTTGQLVTIGSSGQLIAEGSGVHILGGASRIENSGLIQCHNWGIYLQTSGAGVSNVSNYGTIVGGTAIGVMGTEKATIRNHGTIEAGNALYAGDGAIVQFTNHGDITGEMNFGDLNDRLTSTGSITGTIRMGDGDDTVTLKGSYDGIILLGAGADSYEGRRLEDQDIRVLGDEGNDYFQMGGASEMIEGGAGQDAATYFRASSGVKVYLDFSGINSGAAAGDEFYDLEGLAGSNFDDRLQGNDLNNLFYGGDADDTILGGLGDDTISGDQGGDRLTGGAGNDVFAFWQAAPGRADVVTDFSNQAGNNDVIRIYAANFGAGLVAGPVAPEIVRIAADHVAQDADDRFLFDTTDKSLWFDPDGNGAGLAAMIVDLQASATFSLADLELI